MVGIRIIPLYSFDATCAVLILFLTYCDQIRLRPIQMPSGRYMYETLMHRGAIQKQILSVGTQ